MKKTIYILILTIVVISSLSFPSYAGEYEEIWELTDEQTREYLNDIGIDEVNLEELFEVTPLRILKFITELAFKKGITIGKEIIKINAVFIISSIAMSFLKENNRIKNIIYFVSTLVILSFIIKPITRMLIDTVTGIKTSTIFIDSYLPIMTSIIVASRNPALALTYNSFSIYISVLISNFADKIFLPIISSMLAFAVLSSFSTEEYKNKIIQNIRKLLITVLSFASTLFTGILTTKSILASSSDSVAARGIKFISGTFIPVVGGNVGDAISSVFSSFVLMKNTIGVFIIVVILVINIPIIVEMLIWYFVLQFCSIISSLFGVPYITEIFDNMSSIISLLNIIMFFITFILTISTGVIIIFGK